jgi:hypothetical protein
MAVAAALALWPVALLLVAARFALARRWRSVAQVAWLLPLWTIAASIGLTQLGPLLQALADGAAVQRPLWVWVALLVALCCGGLCWALLVTAARAPATEPAPR